MSFDVRTFSIVSPVHVESVQQIIVAMGRYVNRTGVRLHDIYKLNTNTARKGEDQGSVSLHVCLSVCLPACLYVSRSAWLSVCQSVYLSVLIQEIGG